MIFKEHKSAEWQHPALGKAQKHITRSDGVSIRIDDVAVLAATFDDEHYYVVPSNETNDDKFPPRGPFSKEAVVAYLRLAAK